MDGSKKTMRRGAGGGGGGGRARGFGGGGYESPGVMAGGSCQYYRQAEQERKLSSNIYHKETSRNKINTESV